MKDNRELGLLFLKPWLPYSRQQEHRGEKFFIPKSIILYWINNPMNQKEAIKLECCHFVTPT